MSQIDVEHLQVLYRIIFGTDCEPRWEKTPILYLEECKLADDSEKFARMLDRALNVTEEVFEVYMLVAGIEDGLFDR
jgi:hypothetical protein